MPFSWLKLSEVHSGHESQADLLVQRRRHDLWCAKEGYVWLNHELQLIGLELSSPFHSGPFTYPYPLDR